VLVTDFPFEPFVPIGRSIWEIGTSIKAGAKATSDYSDSVGAVPEAIRKESTFIFVTPLSGRRDWQHTWKGDDQANWLEERRKKGDWQDVRVIDGTKLIDWLDKFPSVVLWLADKMSISTQGIESLEQRWEIIKAIGSPPLLSPGLFLTNRDPASAKVRESLSRNALQLQIDTHFPDQVVPFLSACVAEMETDQRVDIVGRSIIAMNPEAWKAMVGLPRPHVLVADFDMEQEVAVRDLLLARAKRAGHIAIYRGSPGGPPHPNRVTLAMPTISQIKESLRKAGYSDERARVLAERTAGNLSSLLRLLQRSSLLPEWADNTQAADLAVAELLGSWNEGQEADRAIAERIAGKSYGEWIATMRDVATRAGTPLIQSSGAWKLSARYEAWYALGPKIFDEHLDRLADVATVVLREKDPQFDLPREERFAANVRGKVLAHSRSLRTGLAESLALVGGHGRALTSASPGKAEATAVLSVRAILKSADWVTWASLNDVLPLLAEAAPQEFMNAIEAALIDNDGPFPRVFAQEGEAVTGWNYMTGILWALETIAWDPEHLIRAATLLAGLAKQDPGGKWSNRPDNSLSMILLPWFPQTVASLEKRRLTVEAVVKEAPDVGWHLLLNLLPQSHSVSMGTRKPSWRPTIPEDWKEGTTRGEYWRQVTAYAEIATDLARADITKLSQLIERLEDLPLPAFERVLEHLKSPTVRSAAGEDRMEVWTSLTGIISRHSRFSQAQWAMPAEKLELIERVAKDLVPEDPSIRNRRLFSERDFDLYEGTNDWEKEARLLEKRREEAVSQVYGERRSVPDVLDFAANVDSPWHVGVAFGSIATDVDSVLLPDILTAQNSKRSRFIEGFVVGRFHAGGWDWVDATLKAAWTPEHKGQFLAYLPFIREAWSRVASVLGTDAGPYWTRTNAWPYQTDEGLSEAIEELLRYERPRAAVRCLGRLIHDKKSIKTDQAIRALLMPTKETAGGIDSFEIAALIKNLQDNPETDVQDLTTVEWTYLSLIDSHNDLRPVTLERRLASDPGFFCELIRILYRSKNAEEAKEEPSEEQKSVGKRAFRLFHTWATPPGTQPDGSLDAAALNAWLDKVKSETSASGHLEVAMITVGHVLAHSPPDPAGLWIHRAAAALLDAKDGEDLRSGFTTELYNLRGAHWVDPSGAEERKLAADYRRKADEIDNARFHRVAISLREMADGYIREAERIAKETDNA